LQNSISKQNLATILHMQQNEITEYEIYTYLAAKTKDPAAKEVLSDLAAQEYAHYEIWKTYTGQEFKPQKLKVIAAKISNTIFGFTFTIKKMENGESLAQDAYEKLFAEVPEAKQIHDEEEEHENKLIDLLDEERLKYVGSMVLGLNDALVELTGTLAGLTLAMGDTKLIALSGLITGISATFSMASSEFLAAKSEGRSDALKSCSYTGIAYLITVALLILPYLIFSSTGYLMALGCMLLIVVLIIAFFNYYISVAQGLSFKKRFTEMASISLGVATLSFVIGLIVKNVLGVDI